MDGSRAGAEIPTQSWGKGVGPRRGDGELKSSTGMGVRIGLFLGREEGVRAGEDSPQIRELGLADLSKPFGRSLRFTPRISARSAPSI